MRALPAVGNMGKESHGCPNLLLIAGAVLLLSVALTEAQTYSPPPPPLTSTSPPLQAALLNSVRGLLDPMGVRTATWDPSVPCSGWEGVACDSTLNIVNITLTYSSLNGTLPSELGSLTSLVVMNFTGNWLTGGIPDTFYTLTNLQTLDLSHNSLNGSISAAIGNLTALTTLDLSDNGLTDSIPSNVGALANLQYLHLERNLLNGAIPDVFSALTVLADLSLGYNSLSGGIPASLAALPALAHLDLSFNALNGSISSVFASSPLLQTLNLASNSLSGELPSGFAAETSPLLELNLGMNALTGSIPAWFPNNLTLLNLKANSLTGYLFSSFQTPPLGLKSLILSNNSLSGPIPESFQTLTSLQELDLNSNLLSGNLPANLSLCANLTILDLGLNLLSGPFPPSYAAFPLLQQLNIQSNSISGTLSSYNFANCTACVKIALNSNQFSGGLPIALPPRLLTLDVSFNALSGEIDGSIFSLVNLTAVLLNNNEFSGAFPYQLWNSSVLQYVAANNNSMSSVPSTAVSDLVTNELAFILLDGNPVCDNHPSTLSPVCILPKDVALGWTPGESTSGYPTTCHVSGSCPAFRYFSIPAYSETGECICSEPLNVTILLSQCPFLVFGETFDLLSIKLRKAVAAKLPLLTVDQVWVSGASQMDARGAQLVALQFFGGAADYVHVDKAEASKIVTLLQANPNLLGATWGPATFISSELTGEVADIAYGSVTESSGSGGLKAWAIAVIIVGSLTFLAALLILVYSFGLRKGGKSKFELELEQFFVRHIPFYEVDEATNSFHADSVLGEGGFGTVYKGETPNGVLWAVKRAKKADKGSFADFQREVRTISRFAHSNIVKLVGYCDDKGEQILVYEFCENGTLTQHVRRDRKAGKSLTFDERLDIAIGAAEGIRYMHTFSTPAIIHRDIKSDNILLDQNMQAKVADFGLLKDLPNYSAGELDERSLHIAGTPGYMDPEYWLTFKVTTKSDVYSFGVVLLELITGLPPVIQDPTSMEVQKIGLASWASPHIRLNQLESVIDPSLEGNFPEEAMAAIAKVALECVERLSIQRPDMTEVANRLGNIKAAESRAAREDRASQLDSNRTSESYRNRTLFEDVSWSYSETQSISAPSVKKLMGYSNMTRG